MKFKYLNLKKARVLTTNNRESTQQYPGRRTFVKAMGLGALAWNPLVNSLKSITTDSLKFKLKNNQLKVYLNNILAWEISEKYFEPGFTIQLKQTKNNYSLTAKRLKLRQTDFGFSLKADIYNKNGPWEFDFNIPEFRFKQTGNFYHWLENTQPLTGKAHLQHEIAKLNPTEFICARGTFNLELEPNWKFNFSSSKNVQLSFNRHQYSTGRFVIQPQLNKTEKFLKSNLNGITLVSLPEFNDWKNFINNIDLIEGSFETKNHELPELCFALDHSKSGEKLFWIQNEGSLIQFQPEKVSESDIQLKQFFYYAEYLNNKQANSYISACLPENGTWINNSLGSFKIERDNKIPDFEAFGTDNNFDEIILEPRLRAFKPNIGGAIALNSVFQDPVKVRIIQPQKKVTTKSTLKSATTIQSTEKEQSNEKEVQKTSTRIPVKNLNIQRVPQKRPTREIQKNQPKINVEFDRVKFKPKRALSIKVLRPEDMVLLEFVFHNFNFTNKGQSPYLELDKTKEIGIVEIYFQSQHTLEEAYFESTPIPDPEGGSSETVRLPAKHLRARKSRLVYELPAGHEGFPLIMSELLDWTKFKLRVHPRAWIKIPTIKRIRKPSRVILDKRATVQANKNLKYLDTPSTEYGIKLAQNTKIKASNLDVYQENEVSKVLAPTTSSSIKMSFNTKTIKKISWKVEPIPELSTSIEAPTLMYISPNQTNDFYHKTEASFRDVEQIKINRQVLNTQLRVLDPLSTNKGEITELWHTRLGVKLKNGQTSGSALPHFKTIRALWADDADANYKVAKERNYPFMASLDANNRQKLVHTTSNYNIGFEPFPVPVNDLMLTTLGAYLDWHAFFDVPTPQDTDLNIIEWEHIATLGRDHFVKIVEEGYLFPFGHRAAVVKITERKFHPQTKAAVNRQRMFIVVLEKEILYSRNDPDGKFIEFPFQEIRIETNATPNIDNPEDTTLINVPSTSGIRRSARFSTGGGGNTTYNFYINVGGQGFPFDIIGTDKEGKEHPFRMPLAFMENRIARDKSLMEDVIEEYQGKQSDGYNKEYNEADFYGQEVAYAEYLVDGDTAFETEMVKFDAQIYPVNGEGDLKFHPNIKEAKVFVKQIDELTGVREPATIGLEDDDNKGGVFARVISDSVVDFSGGSDKSGGFMVPNMAVSGLSKLQGPVSGNLDDLKDLLFIPDDFFKAFEDLPVAKIFGVIEIFDLLFGDIGSPFDLGGSFDDMIDAIQNIREEIDNLKNEILYLENLVEEGQQAVEDQIDDLKQMIKDKVNELLSTLNDSIPRIPNLKSYFTEEAFYAEYKWQPQLGGTKIEIIPSLLNVNVDNPSNALTITTKFEKPFDAEKPASINGVARFEKFGIDIVPLLIVNFNYLEFRTGSTDKTDVKVDIDKNDPIKFQGVLNFVNNLQSIIPSGGFSDDGPYIDLKPTSVTAGFNISIPNVEVGICMISNISLGANVTLPFTGAPLTLGFNFCKRENPFMLTISCFGGGGYFMMVTTLKGIQSIEAAFEFGAAMSLNVGVASGGVSAMGGFYYKMEIVEDEEVTTLSGYLRLNGHLSILGLISVSLEFYLAFNAVIYAGKVQKLEGVATLKVKVEVLFFSKTVSVSVRRELKGADADPKFIEMIDQDDWQEYCLAFAS
ncbi:MAG: hypothetical protein HN778_16020 [Prolixibacteraceae bacterium]|jgi:hypothetical protein|nr:hypothetical protein [Prolixibacteraceae bacterium]MBT6767006.1 hypothetical protein [Prolixibacteraceae bacterium]MBT7000062.1 hypothetical protein [Prolixibacteraceae bacterium]MBT7396336.1 hypothetical protein [Prolixibacteraceae bacterium]